MPKLAHVQGSIGEWGAWPMESVCCVQTIDWLLSCVNIFTICVYQCFTLKRKITVLPIFCIFCND
jgi:LytS/YehU family sensor histidine kinase